MNVKQKAETYTVTIGSNTHMNSNGILKVRGKELLKLERGFDDQLLLTTEVRDVAGKMIAKIWRNNPSYVNPNYQKQTTSKGTSLRKISILRKSDNNIIFEADVKGRSEIEINGTFNIQGIPIVATKDYLDVAGIRLSHSTFDSNGTDICIG